MASLSAKNVLAANSFGQTRAVAPVRRAALQVRSLHMLRLAALLVVPNFGEG